METRLNKDLLLKYLAQWNSFLKRKIHCIACGGTAMTLLGVKISTRDIDFMVPDIKEYNYLINTIEQLGYRNVSSYGWARKEDPFRFDLFPGNKIHTTELLENPLKDGRNLLIKEFSHMYVGVLNDYDLIVSKLFRGEQVDFEDTVALAMAHKEQLDMARLEKHFMEMLSYHPVGEGRVKTHWDTFQRRFKEAVSHGQ
jgi:hypothetical protein